MKFQEIKVPQFDKLRMWSCKKGFWSFVIQTDDKLEPDVYFCTYRDMRKPLADVVTKKTAEAIFFKDDKELKHANATDEFAFKSFTQAVEACRRKHKELVTR